MSEKVFTMSESPVRSVFVRKPKGVTVVDNLAFLSWLDQVLLKLLQLQGAGNQVAWSDCESGHYVINLAVDVAFPADTLHFLEAVNATEDHL